MSASNSLKAQQLAQEHPKVIVDFSLLEGGLYLVVINASTQPAYDVGVRFSQSFKGHHGSVDVTRLPILKSIPCLAPYKRIQIFIDPVEVFFYFNQLDKLTIQVQYKDKGPNKKVHREKNVHDLSIYHQLPPNTRIDFLIDEP